MPTSDAAELMQALQEPFAPDEIRWRVGRVALNGERASLLCYIDARAVMDRLDDVVGPSGWSDSYRPGADGGLICRLELLIDGEWVSKEDGAENTDFESVKGGLSDAYKRAAVKWGIGRYLYRLTESYHKIQRGAKEWANGRGVDVSTKADGHIGWVPYPQLPAWAMPSKGRRETKAETEVRRGKHDSDWERGGRERFFARLGELGWCYDDVLAELAITKPNATRPSAWSDEHRKRLLLNIEAGTWPPKREER